MATFDTPAHEFLEALFAEKATFLERDPFASIGEAASFFTKVVGVSFEGRQARLGTLRSGDVVELVRQPENPADSQAIAVFFGVLQLGFLRRQIAARLAPKIDAGEGYRATIRDLTGGSAGKHFGINVFVERLSAKTERGSITPVASADFQEIRRALIGDRSLREAQTAVIERVRGGRRTLAILGTGRGKSLCFQLPAAEMAMAQGKKTLVFYPLRALGNDQHEAMVRRLGPLGLRIMRANGSLESEERRRLENALEEGAWDIALATPEFAQHHAAAFGAKHNRPDLVVIDEAHHLHESRHRAAYRALPEFVRSLEAPSLLALTATANAAAFGAIRDALGIDAWVIDPTIRSNLQVVDARNINVREKASYIERAIAADGKAIVYCNSRKDATTIAERLRSGLGNRVAFYHAGVPSAQRALIEEYFRSGEIEIVVATSAFGEGIDLPDVRDVFLYHLNFDFTQFNQQAGRAGRDGVNARIHLLYSEQDRRLNEYLIAKSAPTIETLRTLYRGLRGLTSASMIRTTFEDIARTLELDNVDGSTVGTAVHIFEEAGLVEMGIDDDGRFIRLLPAATRVDLTETARYAEGLAEREGFERFCELALKADAATLEQIVNRPIFPNGIPLIK
ncbi:MAG TPA: helicase-related protein [Candidatus Baltobacteraceae bacterium]|nr:helicase-related protein [Candidatus Baltobacteraceae bacterium]